MTKKYIFKIFIDENYSKPPLRTYLPNKIMYKHFGENCSIDLADMIDYKISNITRFRYIRFIRNLLKNPIFPTGKPSWISEIPSVSKHFTNTVHNSTKKETSRCFQKS